MINPASIDVTLGDQLLVETDNGEFTPFNIKHETFYMPPGAFILAHTAEFIRVPNRYECIFQLKSSRGREGYEHALDILTLGFTGELRLNSLTSDALRSYRYELACGSVNLDSPS